MCTNRKLRVGAHIIVTLQLTMQVRDGSAQRYQPVKQHRGHWTTRMIWRRTTAAHTIPTGIQGCKVLNHAKDYLVCSTNVLHGNCNRNADPVCTLNCACMAQSHPRPWFGALCAAASSLPSSDKGPLITLSISSSDAIITSLRRLDIDMASSSSCRCRILSVIV